MNTRALWAVFLILLCNTFSVSASEKGKLLYAAHPEFAPMGWAEGHRLFGVGPELVERIFADMGVPVEAKAIPWRRALQDMRNGRVDVIVNIYFTEERAKYMVYCQPHYAENKTIIITMKGKEFEFKQWNDLIGLKGGATLGDSWGDSFDHFIDEQLNVDRVYSIQQNFLKLESGRIDYIISTENKTYIMAKKSGFLNKISMLSTSVSMEKEYVAFSKKSKYIKYIPEFQSRLKEIISGGEINVLIDKYLEEALSD